MPVSSRILSPKLWGDGVHDDTYALQWLIDKQAAAGPTVHIPPGAYRILKTLDMRLLSGTRVEGEGVKLQAGAPMPVMLKVADMDGGAPHDLSFSHLALDSNGHAVDVGLHIDRDFSDVTIDSLCLGPMQAAGMVFGTLPGEWPEYTPFGLFQARKLQL